MRLPFVHRVSSEHSRTTPREWQARLFDRRTPSVLKSEDDDLEPVDNTGGATRRRISPADVRGWLLLGLTVAVVGKSAWDGSADDDLLALLLDLAL